MTTRKTRYKNFVVCRFVGDFPSLVDMWINYTDYPHNFVDNYYEPRFIAGVKNRISVDNIDKNFFVPKR